MTLAFLNLGTAEIMMIFLVMLIGVFGIGYYGRNTALGYVGSALLALFTTPLVAFLIILGLRGKATAK